MAKYEYGRIRVLAEKLKAAGVSERTAALILEGGEDIGAHASGARQAEWMKQAMIKMNRLLDRETRQAVREACACCLTGKRLAISRQIAHENATLEARIAAANEATLVFGHSVAPQEDGQILVRFQEEGNPEYRCACLPHAQGPVSVTYCYCCGGQVKHHLQSALGVKLACTVRSSALSSGGTLPCTFLFRIVDAA